MTRLRLAEELAWRAYADARLAGLDEQRAMAVAGAAVDAEPTLREAVWMRGLEREVEWLLEEEAKGIRRPWDRIMTSDEMLAEVRRRTRGRP